MQCSLNKDHQHLKWQPQKSWTLYQDYQDAHDKQQMQYPLILYSGQNGRCINVNRNFQSQNVQTFGYVCWNTSGQNHDPVWKPSRSSPKESVRSLFGRTLMEKAIWESSIGKRLGKVLNWECLFVNRASWPILSVYVDDIKLAGKTENIKPIWKILMEDVDLGEPTSFLDHVYLGCTQRECQICKHIVANDGVAFESWISTGAKEKTSDQSFGETWCRNNIFLVLWRGRSREEMCGKILRTGE